MMKQTIAIIVQKLNGGGAERTAATLSFFLSKTYDVHLIVFDGRDIKYPYAGTLHDLHLPPQKGTLLKAVQLVRRIAAVQKIKKEHAVTTSISLMDGANLVNLYSACGDIVLTSVRNHMSVSSERLKNGTVKRSELRKIQRIANHSFQVVALSHGVAEDLTQNFAVPQEKITVIYNPCDAAFLANELLKHKGRTSNLPDCSITTMGRMVEQKGQWHLLRAFAHVIQAVPQATLIVLGDGPLKEPLVQLAADLHIRDHVMFLGYVEAPHDYIMRSHMFVFPSLFEGLGNALLEALACGIPCIATDCDSGPREVLAPGTRVIGAIREIEYAEYGVLTAVGTAGHFNATEPLTADEEQLAHAMTELLRNDALAEHYRKQSLQRATFFSPDKIKAEWIALIEWAQNSREQ